MNGHISEMGHKNLITSIASIQTKITRHYKKLNRLASLARTGQKAAGAMV
jgi:hypothetical protein